MDRAGSPDGVSGCEEQPECYRTISTTLIRQHGQRVCCIFCQKETTEGEAVTLQVRVNFFRSLSRLQRRCFGNLDSFSLVWLHYVLSCPIPFSKPSTFFAGLSHLPMRSVWVPTWESRGENCTAKVENCKVRSLKKGKNGWPWNSWTGFLTWFEAWRYWQTWPASIAQG